MQQQAWHPTPAYVTGATPEDAARQFPFFDPDEAREFANQFGGGRWTVYQVSAAIRIDLGTMQEVPPARVS
jgi:hypothetical protein